MINLLHKQRLVQSSNLNQIFLHLILLHFGTHPDSVLFIGQILGQQKVFVLLVVIMAWHFFLFDLDRDFFLLLFGLLGQIFMSAFFLSFTLHLVDNIPVFNT
jgi:hypothetical protein